MKVILRIDEIYNAHLSFLNILRNGSAQSFKSLTIPIDKAIYLIMKRRHPNDYSDNQ
jgi:hypothetical protein